MPTILLCSLGCRKKAQIIVLWIIGWNSALLSRNLHAVGEEKNHWRLCGAGKEAQFRKLGVLGLEQLWAPSLALTVLLLPVTHLICTVHASRSANLLKRSLVWLTMRGVISELLISLLLLRVAAGMVQADTRRVVSRRSEGFHSCNISVGVSERRSTRNRAFVEPQRVSMACWCCYQSSASSHQPQQR